MGNKSNNLQNHITTMKKFIILQSLLFLVLNLQAQITVNDSGEIGINTTTNTNYGINALYSNKSAGTYQLRQGANSAGVSALYSKAIHQSNIWSSAGVKAFATATTPQGNGRCYGVFCGAGNGMEGYNYGIFSVLYYTTKGAAVYGTTDESSLGQYLDNRYAGYFNGPVKVQGNLTVTGKISGLLLTPNSNSGSMSSSGMEKGIKRNVFDNKSAAGQLKGLCINSFFHDAKSFVSTEESPRSEPSSLLPPTDAADSITSDVQTPDTTLIALAQHNAESMSPQQELTAMEKQVLAKQHYEISSEQLEEVFPDLVYENEDGSKSINYVEMVPILVQAINELNAKIEVLEGGNAAKKAATRATGIEETGDNVTLLSLGQNRPNPFGTTTSIEVSIPNEVQKAFIYVYDLQGKKVGQVDITARGKQTVQLNAAALTDGMYLYSLIADGKVIETRRMIIEK